KCVAYKILEIMKKFIVFTAFLLTVSFTAFANNSATKTTLKHTIKTEGFLKAFSIESKVMYNAFDICTVTVTIRRPNGHTYSATASNNQGDCFAAEEAALEAAQNLAAVLE